MDGLKKSTAALVRIGGDWNDVIVKATNVVLDGLRAPACQDVVLTPYSLLWPAGHQVVLLDDGSTP